MENEYFYKGLKDMRIDHDLNQEDIAKIIQTTQQQYGRYENGKREIPTRHIKTLCKYYNVSADYLLGLIDEPRKLYTKH